VHSKVERLYLLNFSYEFLYPLFHVALGKCSF
jgi:hypothetical protein